jgi:hypothetical protein
MRESVRACVRACVHVVFQHERDERLAINRVFCAGVVLCIVVEGGVQKEGRHDGGTCCDPM